MNQRTHIAAVYFLYLAIVTSYSVMAMYYPVAYIWATYEDLYGEWTQTLLFGCAFLFSVRLAFSASRYRWFFSVLALACLYTFLEEISWGQRIFEFDTPEFFRRHNLQKEANIHNLFVGPVSTSTKEYIQYALATALTLFGLVFPLTLRWGWRIATSTDRIGIPAPPLYLWLFFITAAWLELDPFSFNEAEVAEILVGLAMVLFTSHYWFAQKRSLPANPPPCWPTADARRFAVWVLLLAAAVSLAAYTTTRTLYSVPSKKARVDARILNGYEKFAKRYSRYENWRQAANLYLKVHRAEPDRTYILRRLAASHRKLGEDEQFLYYNKKALKIALLRHAKDPESISANITLARTYRQRGDRKQSSVHAEQALALAKARVADNPNSASAAYWLGKAYQQLGNYNAAYENYRNAYTLHPSSTKYFRAYVDLKRRVADPADSDE